MTLLEDWIAELRQYRGSENVSPLLSSVDKAVAALTPLLVLSSGVYTPTLTNAGNTSARTAFPTIFFQVGKMVHVAGRVEIDPTSASVLTAIKFTLPVALAEGLFYNAQDVAGVAVRANVALNMLRATFNTNIFDQEAYMTFRNDTNTANQPWIFHFMYNSAPTNPF